MEPFLHCAAFAFAALKACTPMRRAVMAAVAAGADAAAPYSTPAAAAVYAATAALADPGRGRPAPGPMPRQPAVTALHAACQARTPTPVTVTALGTGANRGRSDARQARRSAQAPAAPGRNSPCCSFGPCICREDAVAVTIACCAPRQAGGAALLEYLLQAGAPAGAPDAGGRTPLHYAILRDNAAAAKLLLCRGASRCGPGAQTAAHPLRGCPARGTTRSLSGRLWPCVALAALSVWCLVRKLRIRRHACLC